LGSRRFVPTKRDTPESGAPPATNLITVALVVGQHGVDVGRRESSNVGPDVGNPKRSRDYSSAGKFHNLICERFGSIPSHTAYPFLDYTLA